MPTKTTRVARTKKDGKGWYSEKQKLDAFALYLNLGNMEEVGRQLNINIKTLYSWKYSPWWKEQYKELETGNKIRLGTKVSGILSKASSELADRLEHGQYRYNRETKTLERRPLETKELVEIMRAGVQTQESVDRALDALDQRDQRDARAAAQLEKLERIAKMLSARPDPIVIDVTKQKRETNDGNESVVWESVQEERPGSEPTGDQSIQPAPGESGIGG